MPEKKKEGVPNPVLVDPFSIPKKGSIKKKTFSFKPRSKSLPVISPSGEILDALQIEWVLSYSHHSIHHFLTKIKGYSTSRYQKFLKDSPAIEWEARKVTLRRDITANLVKTHVDFIAENQDFFLRTAKIGLTRIIELLTKLKVTEVPEFEVIKDPLDSTRNIAIKKNSLKSTDVANCMNALKSGLEVYRKAIGIESESESLAMVLREIRSHSGDNISVNNYNINLGPQPETKGQEMIADASYEELYQMIEMKRKIDSDGEDGVIIIDPKGTNGSGNGVGTGE